MSAWPARRAGALDRRSGASQFSLPAQATVAAFSATPLTLDKCVDARSCAQVNAGEILLEIPDSLAITTVDVAAHPVRQPVDTAHRRMPVRSLLISLSPPCAQDVAPLAEGRGELVGLALWLLSERSRGSASEWYAFMSTRPF